MLNFFNYEAIEPKYYEGLVLIERNRESPDPVIKQIESINIDGVLKKNIVLSDTKKFLINFGPSFYHFIIDELPKIIYWSKQYKHDVQFLISMDCLITELKNHNLAIFILQYLNSNKIDYRIIDLDDTQTITNNLLYSSAPTLLHYEYLLEVINLYEHERRGLEESHASKKVYLSRKKVVPKGDIGTFGEKPKDIFDFEDDVRMKEEDFLESFLLSKGFIIVYPEDFKSFKDQVLFFHDVKTLISSTSAGLINMLWMQPGGNVVELTTPLIASGKQDIHAFYHSFAYVKDHTYISIANERDSAKIVNQFNHNPILLEVVK